MRKLTSLFLLVTSLSFAQSVSEGDAWVNTGIGISRWGVPLYVGGDYMVSDEISVGGRLTYVGQRNRDNQIWGWGRYDYRERYLYVTFMGDYHFNKIIGLEDDFDLYAGLGIGFVRYSRKVTDYEWNGNPTALEASFDEDNVANFIESSSTSPLYSSLHVGARYFFKPHTAVHMEMGAVLSGGHYIDLGVSFKL